MERLQRAILFLLQHNDTITTKQIKDLSYVDRGQGWARVLRSTAVRNAAKHLGLIKVGRLWPDGNVYAKEISSNKANKIKDLDEEK